MGATGVSGKVRKGNSRLFSAASILALAAGMPLVPQAAFAQSDDMETVTVTSTRVQRDGYSAPTPVTSVSTRDIQQDAPTTVGAVLANLPSFRPTSTPTTSGVNSLGGGQITADLRGLGASRTLVLVNGERFVPAASDGTVDLTQIPTLLVNRIEVVTGGASAAYGSDAVTGVVNFILKDHIDGFQGSMQYGQSQYSDDIEQQAAAAYGTKLFSDKLTFTVGANYINNEGILGQYTRPWGRKEVGLVTNTAFATNGLPNYIITPGDHTSTESNGGLVVSGPLKGLAFDPNGATHQFVYGTVYGTSMIGGEQQRPNPTLNSYLGKPFNAITSLAHLDYEIDPDIKAYMDISASRTGAGGASQQARDAALVIKSDNAYLPASVKTAMAANGVTTITIGRYYDDTGPILLHTSNHTGRIIGGFEGKFNFLGDWNWNANYQYGQNRYFLNFGPNNRNQANFLLASDAVVNPATGSIVCRSTLTNPSNGCIPVNVLGDGSETLNSFVNGSATYHLVTEQSVAALNLNGNPFSTWAGVVSVASGLEYRREAGRAIADGVSTQVNADGSTGGWALGNQKNYSGAYNIYEGYLETVVPILSDMPLAKEADINAALRLTSYSTAGGAATWKVGFNYQPVDDLRLRGTRSHDVRAPNLSELYQGGSGSSYTTVADRVAGTVQVRQVGQGNTLLRPEESETYTGGAIYQPSWFPGFAVSADYYNIRVARVISTIGAPTLLAGCYAGNALYCQSVVFNPNGSVNYIVSQSLNLNKLKTSGVDFESSYSFAGDDLWSALDGNFSLHALATYVNELTTVLPGNVIQNTVGQVSNFNRLSGVPKWTGQATATWDFDPLSVYVRAKWIGDGIFSYSLRTGAGAANTINNNNVGAVVYFSLGGSYDIHVADIPVQVFANIDNILNRDPPNVPSQAAGGTNESSTNTVFYDPIGRLYKIGFRFSVD